MSSIAKNLQTVREEIKQKATLYNRSSDEITLLAVSKTKPEEDLREAYAQGQKDFGENYLQEALEKIEALSGLEICWHFIGPLQSNKTRPVAEHFDWVHTVNRAKIAQRLSDQRPSSKPPLNICLQVNISGEESKSGCSITEVSELAEKISLLPNLKLRGLMAIPKSTEQFTEQRQIFAKMKDLLVSLQNKYPDLDTLSMGMSGDMEAAIAEGSTMVRIGTAIFGARAKKV